MIQFRLLNIPVNIHLSFLLFFLFFTGLHHAISVGGLILGAILIVSLLVHEFGHALTAAYFGAKVEVNLEAFGGNAKYTSYGITAKQECLITINGPLFESLLIAIPYFLLKTPMAQNPLIHHILRQTMELNILWCLFNLIPVLPLDGGHILKYLLERWLPEKAGAVSAAISLVFAVAGGAYFILEGYYFFAGILFVYGLRGVRGVSRATSFFPGKKGENPFKLYNEGLSYLEKDEPEKARTIFKKLMKTDDPHIKTWSAESYATILHRENKNLEAYKSLMQGDLKRMTRGKTLLCKLAFEFGNYALIEQHSQEIYELDPSFETAILNSKAFAALNDSILSGGWFKTASLFQAKTEEELDHILNLSVYDAVREKKEFKEQLLS